ncbi:MAG: AzlC family ABC transporter permease [Chloroflexota bacterium]|nr:AzlC family ABC transporter permease [Chloroflexota bacterium]
MNSEMGEQVLDAMAISGAVVRPRREWWSGAIATLPFWPGAALFGLVYAVTARAAGLSGPEIVGMSLLVHAGSAQFAAVNLIAGGAGAVSVIVGTTITNARSLLIGASIAPRVAAQPLWWRLLYAFHLTDESFAVATARFLRGDVTPGYALGANLGMVLPWTGSAIVGVIVGAAIPSPTRWGIDLVIPLTFLGLLVPLLKNRRAVGVALCSGLLALLGVMLLPGTWYLVVAGGGGSMIGAVWQTWEERRACG